MWRWFCLILLLASGCAFAEKTANPEDAIKHLFDQARWPEVVSAVEKMPTRSADLDYYYGSALAQLGEWDQARNAFLIGRRLAPNDKRFPIELAGVAFRQKDYPTRGALPATGTASRSAR